MKPLEVTAVRDVYADPKYPRLSVVRDRLRAKDINPYQGLMAGLLLWGSGLKAAQEFWSKAIAAEREHLWIAAHAAYQAVEDLLLAEERLSSLSRIAALLGAVTGKPITKQAAASALKKVCSHVGARNRRELRGLALRGIIERKNGVFRPLMKCDRQFGQALYSGSPSVDARTPEQLIEEQRQDLAAGGYQKPEPLTVPAADPEWVAYLAMPETTRQMGRVVPIPKCPADLHPRRDQVERKGRWYCLGCDRERKRNPIPKHPRRKG